MAGAIKERGGGEFFYFSFGSRVRVIIGVPQRERAVFKTISHGPRSYVRAHVIRSFVRTAGPGNYIGRKQIRNEKG